MQQQSLSGAWQVRQANGESWMDGMVPGDVHTTLLKYGLIPDPFVGDNEKQVMWVAETDWEYRRTFIADSAVTGEDRVELVCDGLDTLADVYLNGKWLGHTENMFRQYSWEVKDLLVEGENELRVAFGAPVSYITAKQKENPMTGGGDIPGGPHLRKAPCHFGWDWGPKLPPIGIWKDVRLEGYTQARLDNAYLRQRIEKGEDGKDVAVVWAEVAVDEWAEGELSCVLRVTAPDGSALESQVSVENSEAFPVVEVKNPALWWPLGYGAQPLYKVELLLLAGEFVLDAKNYQVGLRTIELRQQPDEWGESFTFVVNDVPVFAKGADWIPADSFPTRISDAYMEGLIRSAAQAHMNMLRVWGGGLYEEERFYDLCDRYGILIWQDFVFACGIYPADAEFAENVQEEAIQNVRRLRHRASLALWCGNNEMEQGWAEWGWNKPDDANNQRLKAGYDRMFHHLLPDVIAAEDPDTPYWPSSASSGIPFAQPSSQARGDCHYWDVWHGRKPFTAYRSQFPRFMSEFGFQALPPFKTIQTYAGPKDQNMTSYIMEHHQRSGSGNGLMIGQMTDTFRMPNSFESLVYLSMVLQAEGIRYGVEHWRRNMHRVSGTLIWQLNDCWPVASWASLDYFGRWKALHYAAKRFYAPVMLSIEDTGACMGLHVTSDLMSAWQGEIHWRLEQIDGHVLQAGSLDVAAPALANTHVATLDFTNIINDSNKRMIIFVAELWQQGSIQIAKMATFCANKHLELVDPQLAVTVAADSDGNFVFTTKAASLARFVELAVAGTDVVFSDNYFDVAANQAVTVTATLPQGWTVAQAQQAVQVRSLYNSF
jgi:beta-mannosidase